MSNISIEENILTTIPSKRKFIALFSGGKDSGLALSLACADAEPLALIHCVDKMISVHHMQAMEVIEQQAASINIPLDFHYKHWSKWPKLVKLFRYYKEMGAEFVLYGDLFREDNASLQITLCRSVGLKACMPLWHRPYVELLNQMEKRKLVSIISVIKSPFISNKWLGKPFDFQAYSEFTKLPIDPFGEYGEYHTTLVDGDIFQYPLRYEIINRSNYGFIELHCSNKKGES